jgi:hypothetical protein
MTITDVLLIVALVYCFVLILGGHPKPASRGHLKTGQ